MMLERRYPRGDREAGTAGIAVLFDLAGRSHSPKNLDRSLRKPRPPRGFSFGSFMRQQRSGKIIRVSSIVGIAPSIVGGYPRYEQPGVMATGRITQTVISSSRQSNRVGPSRSLYGVENGRGYRVVEFLATDLTDYVTGR